MKQKVKDSRERPLGYRDVALVCSAVSCGRDFGGSKRGSSAGAGGLRAGLNSSGFPKEPEFPGTRGR